MKRCGVVEVEYPDQCRTVLKALRPGEAEVYIINRYAYDRDVYLDELSAQEREWFDRHVPIRVIVQ